MRASYNSDAAFLLRLQVAVSKDDRQSEGWRRETAAMINQLARRLLEAEAKAGERAPKGPRADKK